MHRNLMAVSLPVIGIVAGAPPALAARSAPARPDTAEAKVTWSPLQDHSGKAVDDRHASGALRIAADISAPGGLEGWTLAVDPASRAAHPGFGPLCQEHFTEPVTRAEVRCDWDTEHRSGREPSANQGYVVRITGDGGGSSLRDGTRAVTVSNPASAPGSLRVDQADGRIRLTWAAAREPDAAGLIHRHRRHVLVSRYRLERLKEPPVILFLGRKVHREQQFRAFESAVHIAMTYRRIAPLVDIDDRLRVRRIARDACGFGSKERGVIQRRAKHQRDANEWRALAVHRRDLRLRPLRFERTLAVGAEHRSAAKHIFSESDKVCAAARNIASG